MIKKESISLKKCLNFNKNSEVYNNFKKQYEGMDKELERMVTYNYYKDYNYWRKLLGTLRNYYEEYFTFEDYYNKILYTVGKGDIKKGMKEMKFVIAEVANSIRKKIYEYADYYPKREEVCKAVLIISIYKSYLGFLFETIVKDILQVDNLFIVEDSKKLDIDYKIDLLVSLNKKGYEHIKIGLQLKSYKYLTISPKAYSKKTVGKILEKVIDDNVCKEIYFLIHDNSLNIIKDKEENGALWERYITEEKFNLHDDLDRNYIELEDVQNIQYCLIDKLLFKILLEYNRHKLKSSDNILRTFKIKNIYEETEKEFKEFKINLYKEKSLNKNANSHLSIWLN